MSRFELSKAATRDLRQINRYTREQFGTGQSARLREHFLRTLQTLAEAPRLAPKRGEYDPPGKTFRYHPSLKSFIVVYEPAETGIRVVRIIHGARNIAAELDDSDS